MKAKISILGNKAEIEADKKEIKSFFDGVVPQFIKETGGIMADTVKFWRFKNQVGILKKANKIIEENNLQKHQVPLKILVPLLESASLEEEETLQDMWASLLVNTTTGEENVRPIFISILKEISYIEAIILNIIHVSKSMEEATLLDILEKDGHNKKHAVIAIDNLRRLNLCKNKTYQAPSVNSLLTLYSHKLELYSDPLQPYYGNSQSPFIDMPDKSIGNDKELEERIEKLENEKKEKENIEREIVLTPLAIALLKACAAPKKAKK